MKRAAFWEEDKVGNKELYVHNGDRWELSSVPEVDADAFRQRILKECSQGARLVNLFAAAENGGGIKIFAILGKDQEGRLSVLSRRIPQNTDSFQSLTPELPQAHMFEREMAEQFSITPVGHPWPKPVRRHEQIYPFYRVEGEEVHEVAVGPVHAGIIEPGHFRFQCHGEKVLDLEIQLGYQRRGVESLMIAADSKQQAVLAKSIAGDTVIGHGLAYCHAMEGLSERSITPKRCQSLRAIAL